MYGAIKIKDDSGAKYAFLNVHLLSKMLKASLNAKESNDLRQARMYEQTEKSKCPVEGLLLYKSYFPKDTQGDTPLFWKIIKGDNLSLQSVVGKSTLGDFMKKLSEKLCLSKTYTNHCIRVTVVTVMREQSVSTSDIMLITGHKNAKSVERYDRKKRDKDLRDLSHKLTNDEYEMQQMPSTSVSGTDRSSSNCTTNVVNLIQTKCLNIHNIP